MENKIDKNPEDMDNIFSKETFEYMCEYRIRSSILRVLKENFTIREMYVISAKMDKKE